MILNKNSNSSFYANSNNDPPCFYILKIK